MLAAARPVELTFTRFASTADFARGTLEGVCFTSSSDAITLEGAVGGCWTGPWESPGFAVDRVIASWSADTPPGSVVRIEVQGRTADDLETGWYVLGLWSFDDADFQRRSVAAQADGVGDVDVDTFLANRPLGSYRLRVSLVGSDAGSPTVRMVGAVSSGGTETGAIPSAPGLAGGIELSVPAYAQNVHEGEYPRYDSGGEAWCSPTSTAMVVAFWGAGPTPAEMAWVDPAIADPWVDHAARFAFDYEYGGAGNWPFNTAYAAHYGLDAFVTRLRSLREAELFLEAGIPLVASISAGPGRLDGFLLPEGTAGHLLVIVGVTSDGDPIVNDPAAVSNATVRRIYDRAQFEHSWLHGSGGVVYVISSPDIALPPSPGNW